MLRSYDDLCYIICTVLRDRYCVMKHSCCNTNKTIIIIILHIAFLVPLREFLGVNLDESSTINEDFRTHAYMWQCYQLCSVLKTTVILLQCLQNHTNPHSYVVIQTDSYISHSHQNLQILAFSWLSIKNFRIPNYRWNLLLTDTYSYNTSKCKDQKIYNVV